MASSLHNLAGNLCGTSRIQCDKCKGNMELINISVIFLLLISPNVLSYGSSKIASYSKEISERLYVAEVSPVHKIGFSD